MHIRRSLEFFYWSIIVDQAISWLDASGKKIINRLGMHIISLHRPSLCPNKEWTVMSIIFFFHTAYKYMYLVGPVGVCCSLRLHTVHYYSLLGWTTRGQHHSPVFSMFVCLTTSPGFLPALCARRGEKWSELFYVRRVWLSYTRDWRLQVSSKRPGNEDEAPFPGTKVPGPGADPGFSFRGGGHKKIMCPHAHCERGTELTFGRCPGPA